MKSRHMIIGVAICGWCGVLVGLALLGRIKDVNSQPDEHAFWHLATAACLGLTFVAFLIFSKRRFLIASLVSLMAATAIGALWIASMWVYLGFSIGGTTPIVVSGTKYAETKSLAVWIARGGISVEFNIIAAIWDDSEQNFKPTDWSKLDYIRGSWGIHNSGSVYYPELPELAAQGTSKRTKLDIWHFAGFEGVWYIEPDPPQPWGGNNQAICGFVCPLWFPILLSLIFPAIYTRKVLRRRNWKPSGRCLVCGFDLRAHKPGEKCPECGTLIPISGERPIPGAQPPPT